MQTNEKYIGSRTATRTMIINGLFIGLTLLATMSINIRLPFMGNGGLIHLGNVPLFIAAIIYGRKTGAITGAFGMACLTLFPDGLPGRRSHSLYVVPSVMQWESSQKNQEAMHIWQIRSL